MQLSRIYHHCFIDEIKYDKQIPNHDSDYLFDNYFSFEQWIIQEKMAGTKITNPGLHEMLFSPIYGTGNGHVHVWRRREPFFK